MQDISEHNEVSGLEKAMRTNKMVWSVQNFTHVEAKDFRKIAPGRNDHRLACTSVCA